MQAMNQGLLKAIVPLIPNSQKDLKGDRKNLEVEGGPLENVVQTEKILNIYYSLFLHVLPPNTNYCCFKRVEDRSKRNVDFQFVQLFFLFPLWGWEWWVPSSLHVRQETGSQCYWFLHVNFISCYLKKFLPCLNCFIFDVPAFFRYAILSSANRGSFIFNILFLVLSFSLVKLYWLVPLEQFIDYITYLYFNNNNNSIKNTLP